MFGKMALHLLSKRSGMTRKQSGFTIIEALVVLGLMAILLGLGLPFLTNVVQRSALDGAARQTASLMQRARMEAIQVNQETLVLTDVVNRRVVSFVDEGATPRVLDAGDRILGQLSIPRRVVVEGPGGIDAVTFSTVDGAIYQGNGAAVEEGTVRFSDDRGNFLQVAVAPRATGRVQIQKWQDGAWVLPGEKPWKWQ